MPVASIIILSYNSCSTLPRAIESILNQKCRYPFEIIIGDDGSTDGSRKICEDYAVKYPDIIHLMPTAPNKGVVDNYFDCLLAAKGDYISDCAADDYWPNMHLLEQEIDFLNTHPDINVVFPDVEENGTILHSSLEKYRRWMRPWISGQEILTGILNNVDSLPYQLSAALYRKNDILQVLEEKPEIVRASKCGVEDIPVMAALASRGDAAYIPTVGYYYTTDMGPTLSNGLTLSKSFDFYARLLDFHPELAAGYGIPLTDLKKHFTAKINHLTSISRKLKDKTLLPRIKSIVKKWSPLSLPLKSRLNLLILRLS